MQVSDAFTAVCVNRQRLLRRTQVSSSTTSARVSVSHLLNHDHLLGVLTAYMILTLLSNLHRIIMMTIWIFLYWNKFLTQESICIR